MPDALCERANPEAGHTHPCAGSLSGQIRRDDERRKILRQCDFFPPSDAYHFRLTPHETLTASFPLKTASDRYPGVFISRTGARHGGAGLSAPARVFRSDPGAALNRGYTWRRRAVFASVGHAFFSMWCRICHREPPACAGASRGSDLRPHTATLVRMMRHHAACDPIIGVRLPERQRLRSFFECAYGPPRLNVAVGRQHFGETD